MYTLEQAFMEHELIVLRVIGEWWEMDLTGRDKLACAKVLADRFAALDLPTEIEYLPPEEGEAMQTLVAAGGRLPVATFSRQYGEVRQMGPGRLEREEPWYEPENVAEALWYRGFMFRGFDDTAEGVIEYYYLPDELMAQFGQGTAVPQVIKEAPMPMLAPVETPPQMETAVTNAIDDLTTLLAEAQRTGLQGEWRKTAVPLLMEADSARLSLLLTLAKEMGMLRQGDTGLRPARTAVSWLQESRESQLRALAEAWSGSNWNELRRVPGLICEGEGWQNDPLLARTALFDALPRDENWYIVADVIATIKETEPDFQRPDGNYDTWYIRDEASDQYLTGFVHWDDVEGRLLHYLLQAPMRWLGLVEVGCTAEDVAVYRLTARAVAWLENEPVRAQDVPVPLVVQADASILVPFNGDRYQRFQTARISEAEPYLAGKPYLYRLTPASLALAQEQGIAADRVLQFLEKGSGRPLPASVKRAIERWAQNGVEGRLETAVVLRVRDAAILDTLAHNPKTRDFIGERLGELAVAIRRDQWEQFREATAQLGLLLDVSVSGDQ
ncbi:MAG: helicase-associated domain-containing protein [Chloroflexota bacterium]